MNPNHKLSDRSPKEILTAAVAKAVSNGYSFNESVRSPKDVTVSSFNNETGRLALTIRGKEFKVIYDNYKLIFFEVKFAKALFGSDWEEHLTNLSVSTNIFSYLDELV